MTAAGPLDEFVEHVTATSWLRRRRHPWRSSSPCARATVRNCSSAASAPFNGAVDVAGAEVDASILVVDNASEDDRPGAVARSLGVDVAREPVPGLDVARNRAVAASRGDVVAFIDDDVVLDPTWLRTLARTIAAAPRGRGCHGRRHGVQSGDGGAGDVRGVWRVLQGLARRAGGPQQCGQTCRSIPRSASAATWHSAGEPSWRPGPFDEALDTGPPLAGGGDLDMLVRMARLGTSCTSRRRWSATSIARAWTHSVRSTGRGACGGGRCCTSGIAVAGATAD